MPYQSAAQGLCIIQRGFRADMRLGVLQATMVSALQRRQPAGEPHQACALVCMCLAAHGRCPTLTCMYA